MKLTKRLYALASLVEDGVEVFDVGCDHGLLSIYLAQNHKVTASDITDYSVNKTKENVSKSNISNITVIKSNGLDNLEINYNSNIIIAGMGTNTILSILKNNKNKLSNTLIIQSNNSHDILRKEICSLGYYIDKELVIIDNNKLYVMIRFKKGKRKYKDIDYILGFSNNNDYFLKLLKRYQDLYNDIPHKYIFRRIKYKKIINKIKETINKSN